MPLLFRAQPLWAQLLGPDQHVPSPHPRSSGNPHLALPYTAFWARWHGKQGSEVEWLVESRDWEVAEPEFSASCLQIPLWELSTQQFLPDDLQCTRLWAHSGERDRSMSPWRCYSSGGGEHQQGGKGMGKTFSCSAKNLDKTDSEAH